MDDTNQDGRKSCGEGGLRISRPYEGDEIEEPGDFARGARAPAKFQRQLVIEGIRPKDGCLDDLVIFAPKVTPQPRVQEGACISSGSSGASGGKKRVHA